MRLAHLVLIVALTAVVLTLTRDPIGRTFVLVFVTGLGEVGFGLAAVMALFQTLGAFGQARTLYAHFEAVAATTVVLALGTAAMSGWLFAGAWLISALV